MTDKEEDAILNKIGRAKISQCMIVKNEEKNIVQALSWGKGIVAEQIVVDTGSTDRTVELAEKMGAKVYSFAWIDDFSAAKNFAISKATGDWIAFLDADEYFSDEDAKKIPALLAKLSGECESVLTAMLQLDDAGLVKAVDTHMRLFRRHPDLRYKNRIHEFLSFRGERPPRFWDATQELSIIHTGYTETENKRKRDEGRNLRLIQRELMEDPDNYEMLVYLGNEYETLEKWDLAEDAYRRAIALMPGSVKGDYDVLTSGCAFRFLELLAVVPGKNESDMMEIYEWAVENWPEEGDFSYIVGNYYAVKGDYVAGERYLRKALETMERYGTSRRSSLTSAKIMETYELLAVCCLNNGDREECVRYTTALLKENRYLMTTAMLFIVAFRQDLAKTGQEKSGASKVAALLGKSFYDFTSLKDRIFVLRAAMDARYPELIEVIRGLFTPEELAQVDRALNKT